MRKTRSEQSFPQPVYSLVQLGNCLSPMTERPPGLPHQENTLPCHNEGPFEIANSLFPTPDAGIRGRVTCLLGSCVEQHFRRVGVKNTGVQVSMRKQ